MRHLIRFAESNLYSTYSSVKGVYLRNDREIQDILNISRDEGLDVAIKDGPGYSKPHINIYRYVRKEDITMTYRGPNPLKNNNMSMSPEKFNDIISNIATRISSLHDIELEMYTQHGHSFKVDNPMTQPPIVRRDDRSDQVSRNRIREYGIFDKVVSYKISFT